jgi:hypothetical protein
MKTKLQTAVPVLILVVLAVLGWWGYDTISKRRIEMGRAHEQQQADRRVRLHEKLAAFARRYDAIVDWKARPANSRLEPFSVELEDVLARADGNPILVYGNVDDVVRRGDKIYLHVDDWHPGVWNIHFVLECDSAMASRVTRDTSGLQIYGIIAKISSVERAEFRLKSGLKDTEGEEPPVELDTSDLFVAHGRCLDLIAPDAE